MIPESVFGLALWAAYGFVAVAALGLLSVLVHEWKRGTLW